jgi:hypothetical protein
MGNQRIELRATLGGENSGNAFTMGGIGSKAVDGF